MTLLEVRAGDPPSAVNMLIRFHRIEKLDSADRAVAAVGGAGSPRSRRPHTSFPVLVYFRSPQPEHSWITAAGAVLDAGSLWAATVEHPRDPDVQL